jgi:hypothetical protein
MRGAGLLGWRDDGENFVPTPGGLLDGLPSTDIGSSLHMFLEPKDIATVPGLPQHVYDEAARIDLARSSAANNQPPEYASQPGQVSLTPWSANSSGLDLSAPASRSADNPSEPNEKYEQGAKAADFLAKGIDLWNGQNKILGLHFGQEGPEMLEKYTGPVGKGLVALDNGLKAAGEIAHGAPALPTLAGAGIKTGSTLGAMALGGEGGAALGGLAAGPIGSVVVGALGGVAGAFAPDWVYGNMSNQQIGEAAGRAADSAGRSYNKYVVNNPYYDPRLMMP